MDAMNTPAKFEVRIFASSWDNRGTQKTGQSLDTPTLPFLPNFQWAFIRMDPVDTHAKFEVRSFTRSWYNRGYSKKFGQSLDTPTLPFLPILRDFCSDGSCEYTCQIWSS